MAQKDWSKLNLSQVLDETAAQFPDKEAIVYKDRRITYGELRENVVKLAKSLQKLGIKKEDKVAIMMTNCPEWAFVRDAVIKLGAWWVPVNTRYKTTELEFILKHAEVKALVMNDETIGINFVDLINSVCPELKQSEPGKIASEKLPDLRSVICLSEKDHPGMFKFSDFLEYGKDIADEAVEKITATISPDDIANITYTSGTTGTPKGVLTTHSQFLRAMSQISERFETTEKDCVLLAAPLFTNMGNLTGLIHGEMYGAKMALFETFDPGEILKGVDEEKISIFTGAPAMYLMIMEHENFTAEKVQSMRTGIIGGAPVTPDVVQQIKDKIGMKLFSAYGMTENSAITTMSTGDDPPEKVAHTCGRLLFEDCEMKIVDPESGKDQPPDEQGEVRTRGWLVTQGYYKNLEETAKSIDKEGWFHTGDLGVADEQGYLRITGRLKDMIISGGLNIDPMEIEILIAQHPAVAAVQVVGLPEHRMGEVVGAFIVLNEGATCTDTDIIEFCTDKIGKYKIPKYVKFVPEFPITAYGKIQKFKLRETGIKEFGLS
ncbi:AMP-binding protein [Thermodesulfobacteriota bacterium]